MVAAWQLAVEQCEFSAKYLVMKILIISWLKLQAEGGWRRSAYSDKGTLICFTAFLWKRKYIIFKVLDKQDLVSECRCLQH